jgi:SAM-dependent methyltransferase
MTDRFNKDYWDGVANNKSICNREELWRAHLKNIYQRFISGHGGIALKTDLYDEAISEHNLLSLLEQHYQQVVGLDHSSTVAQRARQRITNEKIVILVSDVRCVPFEDNSFDCILSNSTLDHFPSKKDIITSLKELYRILKPHGRLIISLDNPSNPVIRLRNALPYKILKSIGIIPYYMGVTLSKTELIRAMEGQGFKIKESSVIVHCPRFFAIWTGFLVNRLGSKTINKCFLKILDIFEYLENLPSKYLTGYFVCVEATKE